MKKGPFIFLYASFLLLHGSFLRGPMANAQNVSDTLLNFNTLLGGVTTISIPQDQKMPQGFQITSEWVLMGPDTLWLRLAEPLQFKVETGNGDVFEVKIKSKKQNGREFVVVSTDRIEMAQGWRKDGKIWVVVVVSSLVFAAIVAFLWYLERRLSRLEKIKMP